MGFFALCAVIGLGLLAAMTWAAINDRRYERAIETVERYVAERFEASRDETEAAMARSAERVAAWPRLPERPGHAPVAPEFLDEAEVAEDANLLIAAALSMCRRDAQVRENAALMDEYAGRFPMQERPRLVDRADSNPSSTGDQS